MADLPAQNQDECNQLARNLLRTRRRGIDIGPGSDWDMWALTLGHLAWIMFEQARTARRLLTRARAFGDYLKQYAFEMGIGRNLTQTSIDATPAKGKVIILSNTASQTLPAGFVLQHADGTTYTLDASVTTSASATKTLRVGNRSGRRRIFQGHAGSGFLNVSVGEVYQYSRTGEYVAIRDVDNALQLKRYLFDLYNDLDDDTQILDTFVQKFGAVASVTATAPGMSGNKDPKDTLLLTSPPGTIQATAFILHFTSGDDAMSTGQVQRAIDTLLTERMPALTVEGLRQLVLSYPGVDLRECYVVPSQRGLQSYQLFPIQSDSQYCGTVTLGQILAYVTARVPQTQLVTEPVYEVIDTSILLLRVHVSGIYEPDWSTPIITLNVTASTSTSLTVSATPPMAVGDRVIITNIAPYPYVVQRRVQSLGGGNVINLDKPLPFPATGGSAYVSPGGPLADAIIEAVYGAYEARSPTADGVAVRYPVSDVSDDPTGVVGAVSDVIGVNDVVQVAASSSPMVFPSPGAVLVPAVVISMSTERTV